MRFKRRRSDRPDLAPRWAGSSLEVLEKRELLSTTPNYHFYQPTVLPIPGPVANTATVSPIPATSTQRQLSFLDNEGKILTGTDQQGDQWTITVHGPGSAIVTDTTPNDGLLDDDINTIQLIGTNINTTYVTGTVVASAKLQTTGTITFNHLISIGGVNHIQLNGFTLAQTIAPPAGVTPDTEPAIFLPGGVRYLSFHNIQENQDLEQPINPIDIVIGNPNTPLTVAPVIHLDSIFNTVFDSGVAINPPTAQTQPTVNILVNGQLHGLDIVSVGATAIPAAQQFAFPTVGITGRTAVQAVGVDKLKVVGSTRNLTVARQQVPFQNGLSGIDHLGSATFGGKTDALGLDVAGPIGTLKLQQGLGNPTGFNIASMPTAFGTPTSTYGYPANGYLGGLVTATKIGKLNVGPANIVYQTSQNPTFVQLRRQGLTYYFTRPGNAATNAAIVSSGNIGQTHVVGNLQQSEIKAGFHYPSFVAGLEGTRANSKIGPVKQQGSNVDGVVSATVRPKNHVYNVNTNVSGKGGSITGNMSGTLVQTGAVTALNNIGSGYFAFRKRGYLPPPEKPHRVQSVLVKT
jgi:hypothetical protein